MTTRFTKASAPAVLLSVLVSAVLLAGCGSSSGTQSAPVAGHHHSGTHVMPDGTVMKDSQMNGDAQMKGMDMSSGTPSDAAAMICNDETAAAVQRTFALTSRPAGLHSFSDQLFTCSYQLTRGDLRLSVKDVDTEASGRAYYDRLQADLAPVTPIRGMAAFGFPAFQSTHGDVVFIKDHKTLWVDASRVRESDLPHGSTRTEAAYAVAAAVIACWTE
jgi:hypothetical protein